MNIEYNLNFYMKISKELKKTEKEINISKIIVLSIIHNKIINTNDITGMKKYLVKELNLE